MAEYRRKAPRRPYNGYVGVLHKGKLRTSSCLQVGEGGALVKGSPEIDKISVGDNILMTFFFTRIGGVIANSEVLYRSKEGHIGVGFRNIQMDYKKVIREYVSRRKQESK